MVRTQLQIDEETYEALRSAAHKERKSMSAVARDILREHLITEHEICGKEKRRLSFISAGSSGRSDISTRHDEYLAEDYS